MEGDERSRRVAVVADELLNPPAGGIDALEVLAREGWGVLQLPAASFPDAVAGPLLEQAAEHVEEFLRHGYEVVLIGERDGLAQALAAVGIGPLDAVSPGTPDELRAFLADLAVRGGLAARRDGGAAP